MPLLPSSSDEAVATKSAGAAAAHFCSVMAFSSGELSNAASATVSTATTTQGDDELLDDVVATLRARARAARPGRDARAALGCRSRGRRHGDRAGHQVGAVGELVDRRHHAPPAHEQHVPDDDPPSTSGSSATWMSSAWPTLSTLNQAPMPTELMPSLASAPIHCESKLVCTR